MNTSLKVLKVSAVCLLITTTTACGYIFGDDGVFRDNSEDYKRASELAVIQLPEGADGEALQEIYAIPVVRESVVMAGEFEVPRPAALTAGAGDELVRIQKLGDDSWALAAVAPGQLWPQVRGFLAAANIPLGRVDASAGIMESAWLEMEGQELKNRYRFRIEQGVQRGTSELHVLQMSERGSDNSWPAKSDDFERESDMLLAVSQFIANSADNAPVSMVAEQAMSASGKIALHEADEGYYYLSVGLPFNRAWASLAKALEDSTFEITDRDRSAGVYYVRFLGPDSEEDAGWFDWLFGGEDENPMVGREFTVKVTSESPSAVIIRLQPQQDIEGYEQREEQGLLALIRGNIS